MTVGYSANITDGTDLADTIYMVNLGRCLKYLNGLLATRLLIFICNKFWMYQQNSGFFGKLCKILRSTFELLHQQRY